MDIDNLIVFCKYFRSVVNETESPGRTRIITFKDVLYCCMRMNGNSHSYSMTNLDMYIDDIIDVHDQALQQKRDTVGYCPFKTICKELLNFVYKDNNTPRIIGVDGTYIPLSIELEKYGFRTSKKSTYCTGLISSLYDINEGVLINYRLCQNNNERDGLKSQIKYLRPGDTLIMDRGYYSKDLLLFLTKMEMKVIFRMKKSDLDVKEIIKNGQPSMRTKVDCNGEMVDFRIVTYKIDGISFFLGTNIMNHTVPYFQNLYWQRWTVETNFRVSKYLLSLNNILSKHPDKVRQDIYVHNILFIIHAIFNNHLQQSLPANKFVNTGNLFTVITNRILYPILYKKITPSVKEMIERICLGLLKTPVITKPGRHYKRVRITPVGKWYWCHIHEKQINQ
jgi:hypothetical protein